MKVKIKGLVFVGFAAAILSANAMAAATDANTVTSKAYTEATYQHKEDRVVNWENGYDDTQKQAALQRDDLYPSMKTLDYEMGALIENIGGAEAKQNESTADWQVGNDQGTWSTVTNGTYTTISQVAAANGDNPETVKIEVNATTEGTLPDTDAAKLPTAGAVKTYADSKVTVDLGNTTTEAPSGQAVTNAVNAKLNHKLGADGTQEYPSTDAGKVLVIDATGEIRMSDATGANTYQSKSTNAKLAIADGNGGWTTLDTKVGGGTYVTATANDTTGAVNFDVTGDQITQSYNAATWNTQGYSDNLTTEAAVAGAINAATGGTVIPAMNTTVCNATTPCALVAEANGKVHWRVMAVSDPQATAAGTCGDVGGCGE